MILHVGLLSQQTVKSSSSGLLSRPVSDEELLVLAVSEGGLLLL